MSDQEEIIAMINDCAEREGKLTDWEREFISSIHDQIDNGRKLSDRQIEILDEAWERVT